MAKKYATLEEMLIDNLVEETEKARDLTTQLKRSKKRGYLTKKEFLQICLWKSPRPKRHYEENSEEEIKKTTKKAFLTPHEITKINRLTKLMGVSIPTASAILALTDPKNYGVIDIRVWKVLRKFDLVRDNPEGINFTPKQWYKYLIKLRYLAKKLKKPARIIELTMFFHHKEIQKGKLYKHQ